MTPDALLYALHTLAALIWVGGMFFAWMILRPAAVSSLEAPARLTLWAEVLRRFFLWVWLAVGLLPISGVGLLHLRFAGFAGAPKYVQIMMGLYRKRPARPPFARTPRPASCAFSSRGFIWKRCTRGASPGLGMFRPGGTAG